MPKKETKRKKKKTARVIKIGGLALLFLLLAALIVHGCLCLFAKNYYPTFGNTRLFAIVSDSMEPEIKTGSLIVSRVPKSEEEIKVGTVITYAVKNEKGKPTLITHRVKEIRTSSQGGKCYVTKGDNAKFQDSVKPEFSDIVGVYTGKSAAVLGYIIGFLQSSNGVAALIFIAFILFAGFIMLDFIDGMQKRKKLENKAIRKSAVVLLQVNRSYGVQAIDLTIDVLDTVLKDPKNKEEEKKSEKLLQGFVDADIASDDEEEDEEEGEVEILEAPGYEYEEEPEPPQTTGDPPQKK